MVLQPNSAASADPALHCGTEGSLMAVDTAIHPELDGPRSLYTTKENRRARTTERGECLSLKKQKIPPKLYSHPLLTLKNIFLYLYYLCHHLTLPLKLIFKNTNNLTQKMSSSQQISK